jgi:hypothetical protein
VNTPFVAKRLVDVALVVVELTIVPLPRAKPFAVRLLVKKFVVVAFVPVALAKVKF